MKIISVGGTDLSYDHNSTIDVSINVCPLSNTQGKRVFRKTLATHILPKYWKEITETGYYFCPTKECPVVYFNQETNVIFAQPEIRTPVMHKMDIGTPNRPVCYCKNVLEEVILDELIVKKCCDNLNNIQEFTEANTGKDCVLTNPTGRCCGKQVREILEWANKKKEFDIEVPLMEQAMSCCAKIEKNVREL